MRRLVNARALRPAVLNHRLSSRYSALQPCLNAQRTWCRANITCMGAGAAGRRSQPCRVAQQAAAKNGCIAAAAASPPHRRALLHTTTTVPTAAAAAGAGSAGQTADGAAAAANATAAAAGPAPLTLEDALSRARAAVGAGLSGAGGRALLAHGTGTHLGSRVAWSLRVRRDGAFYEEVRSKYLTYKFGHDGGIGSACWEVDPSGVARRLELDDHESMLLALLVRSGVWLDPEAARGRLEFRGFSVGRAPPPAGGAAGSSTSDAAPTGSSSSSSSSSNSSELEASIAYEGGASSSGAQSQVGPPAPPPPALQQVVVVPASTGKGPARRPTKRPRRITVATSAGGTATAAAAAAASSSTGESPAAAPVYIDIVLTGTRMVARVELCPVTWRPVGFGQALAGGGDPASGAQPPSLWAFEEWQRWDAPRAGGGSGSGSSGNGAVPLVPRAPGLATPDGTAAAALPPPLCVHFPLRVRHNAAVGGAHDYFTASVALQPAAAPGAAAAYSAPLCTALPVDASFDASLPAGTWAWKAPSGHVVAAVDVAGLPPGGLMLLDTGASGLVLQAGLAARHGLARFGRLNIAGLTGRVSTRFARAGSLKLGPLTLRDPVFMEMDVAGLVRGLDPPPGDAGSSGSSSGRGTSSKSASNSSTSGSSTGSTGGGGIIGIAGYDVFRRALFEFPTPEETAAAIGALGGGSGAVVDHEQQQQQGGPWPAEVAAPAPSDDALSSASAAALLDATLPLQEQLAGAARPASVAVGVAAHADAAGSVGAAAAAPAAAAAHARAAAVNGRPPVPVPGPPPPPPGRGLAPVWVGIHPPDAPPPASSGAYVWFPLRLIGNLPHAELTFAAPHDGAGSSSSSSTNNAAASSKGSRRTSDAAPPPPTQHTALLMVDSGAGGADVLFHGRATRELGLVPAETLAGGGDRGRVRSVRGVGGDGAPAMRVVLGELPWAVWGGGGGGGGDGAGGDGGTTGDGTGRLRFERLRALFALRGGLDVSLYSAGIVGADLLGRTRWAVDYGRGRIGLMPPPPPPPASAGGASSNDSSNDSSSSSSSSGKAAKGT